MLQLGSILILGVIAQWLAWKIKQPAILPLIVIGLLIGPFSTFFTPDGSKLIDGDQIFSGDLLFSFVSLSVGVILFEGGLTLNLKEVKTVASTVRNLLIIGVLVTFIGGAFASYLILDLSLPMAMLFGALIIVSGPTVVLPILRNVKPNAKINTILKWEGILIDPLGALIAVLVYEFIKSSSNGNYYTLEALKDFFTTISIGFFIGGIGALFIWYLIGKNKIPDYLRNVFTLGMVILVFTISDVLQKEAGLLATTIMGIVLANLKLDDFKKILSFKEDISLLLVTLLFILLSSRIEIQQIEKLGINSLILFAVVIFILRPLGVWLSSIGSNLRWRETLFIAWIGPRGIVAAAVASLFSLDLISSASTSPEMKSEAELLLPLVFLVIVGTVALQGTSAKWIGKWLGVLRKEPQGVLFVGANEISKKIALYLKKEGYYVLLADTAKHNVKEARRLNIPVYEGNILSEDIFEEIDLSQIGKLMAVTSNSGLNSLAMNWFHTELGEANTYRLVSKEEAENENIPLPKNVLFKSRLDYLSLNQLLRSNDDISEVKFYAETEYEEFMEEKGKSIIPLFIIKADKQLTIISGFPDEVSKDDRLIFLKNRNFSLDKNDV
jgi:NhaP-type Na+/H+ or K+/H+ antiporter